MEVAGPIAIRRFVLEKKCDVGELHAHNYDHTTLVLRGSLTVRHGADLANEAGPYRIGEYVVIKSGVPHSLKAQEDGTQYACIFSHRDFDGSVIQVYNGNQAAYV